jgi:hypothetical protein
MDITPGHWIFAIIFAISFIGILIWSFRKDKKVNTLNYGNSGKVTIIIGGTILLIIILKFALRQINH